MANRKVRVGQIFFYVPVMLDKLHPPAGDINFGDEVVVVNLHGAPKANTFGHCYVNNLLTGRFAGLVCTNSLVTRAEYVDHLKALIAQENVNRVVEELRAA